LPPCFLPLPSQCHHHYHHHLLNTYSVSNIVLSIYTISLYCRTCLLNLTELLS
jgi:hypothetical protein